MVASVKLLLTVYGHPEPQGSARAFPYQDKETRKWRCAVTTDNPDLKQWRAAVATAAKEALFKLSGQHSEIARPTPVNVVARFYLEPPKASKVTSGWKSTRDDGDKLLRAVFDSLSGIVYEDDSQVAHGEFFKLFGIPERVEIEVSSLCPTNEKLF